MSISETLDRVLKKLHKLKIRKNRGLFYNRCAICIKNMKANFKITNIVLEHYIRNVR